MIIDTGTFNSTTLSSYSANSTFLMHFAGDWNGDLFRLIFSRFNSSRYLISQIDTTDGHMRSHYPLHISSSNLRYSEAFASYSDMFFFCKRDGNKTDIHLVSPERNITLLTTIPQVIVSASTTDFYPSRSTTSMSRWQPWILTVLPDAPTIRNSRIWIFVTAERVSIKNVNSRRSLLYSFVDFERIPFFILICQNTLLDQWSQ